MTGERFGRFVPSKLLGAGGFGEVWKAWDSGVGRWVALKFLKGSGDAEVQRFLREARFAAGVDHPNIARIFDAGEIDGRHYIAMQYVDGCCIAPSKDARAIAATMRDAARGVHAAHEQDIIHRDLKPANIMLDASGHVFVMDFGLARQVEHGATITLSGFMIGTPCYMAPEQARGEIHAIDRRSDVYGLGATLFELLAGRPPFEGADVLSLVMKVVTEEPVLPKCFGSSLDADLETIILTCLRKDPAARYQTAAALADDLDRWLRGEPVLARREVASVRFARFAHRRPLLFLGAGLLLAAVALALGLEWRLRRKGDDLTGTQRTMVDQMLRTSADCYDAAIGQRHAGNLRRMQHYADETERVCRRVMEELPRLAEPHYRLGRIYRAQMRFDEALREQELALARDPTHAGARYERGILRTLASDAARHERLVGWWRERGAEALRSGAEAVRAPTEQDLQTPRSRELRDGARKDFAGLSDPVARAILLWLDGSEDAAAFEQAMAENPDSDDAWQWRARLAVASSDLMRAIDILTRALARDAGNLSCLELRAHARLIVAGSRFANGQDPEPDLAACVGDYDAMLALAPGHVAALISRGDARSDWAAFRWARAGDPSGIFRAATGDLDEVIRLEPGHRKAQESRARVLGNWATFKIERGEDPSDLFAQTLAACDLANATTSEIWEIRGNTLCAQGVWLDAHGRDPEAVFTAAVAALDRAIAINPSTFHPWTARATVHQNWARHRNTRGDSGDDLYQAAISDLDAASRIRITDRVLITRALARLAWAQDRVFDSRDATELLIGAQKDFDAAIAANPRADDCYRGRGHLRITRCNAVPPPADIEAELRLALEDLERAVKMNPSSAENWEIRGVVRFETGGQREARGADPAEHYRGAADDFSRAIAIRGTDAVTFLRRGRARANLGGWLLGQKLDPTADIAAAMADYAASLKINPRKAETWRARGNAKFNAAIWTMSSRRDPVDELKAALPDYDESLKLDKSRDETWRSRGGVAGFLVYWFTLRKNPEAGAPYRVEMERDYGEAIRLAPSNPENWWRRGYYRRFTEKAAEAITDFEEALRLRPSLEGRLRPLIDDTRKRLEK